MVVIFCDEKTILGHSVYYTIWSIKPRTVCRSVRVAMILTLSSCRARHSSYTICKANAVIVVVSYQNMCVVELTEPCDIMKVSIGTVPLFIAPASITNNVCVAFKFSIYIAECPD